MGAFRFLHRWTAIVKPDDELGDAVPLLEDRDRELEDHLKDIDDAVANRVSSSAGVVIYSGSTVDTTSLGGDVTINYPDMSTVTSFVAVNGDTSAARFWTEIASKGTTSGVVRCLDPAGAALVSTLVRIDWIVTGT